MANRRNHYEAAFEAYLRQERMPYVAVDERRRALVDGLGKDGGSIKSLDFIVSPGGEDPIAKRWLVDIKGRRFPSGQKQPQYWRNWSTEDDLRSLARWQKEFGPAFEAALVFAYQLTADRTPTPAEQVFYHQDTPYAFVGIRLADYLAASRPLSARWRTVSMPVAEFRRRAQPLVEMIGPAVPSEADAAALD